MCCCNRLCCYAATAPLVAKVVVIVYVLGWLWEETHVPKVVGSNLSTVYWMDIFTHLFVVKTVMFV